MRKYASLLFLFTLATRALFLSISLDTWDSVQFAMGVEEYNIFKDHPHALGYPVYIAVATFANTFIQNPLHSLILMNVVSLSLASLSLFSIFRLFLKNEKFCALFAALTITNPVIWTLSEIARTETMALSVMIILLHQLMLCIRERSMRRAYVTVFLSALLTGVRPDLIVIFPPVLCFLAMRFSKDRGRSLLRFVALFLLFSLPWSLYMLEAHDFRIPELYAKFKNQVEWNRQYTPMDSHAAFMDKTATGMRTRITEAFAAWVKLSPGFEDLVVILFLCIILASAMSVWKEPLSRPLIVISLYYAVVDVMIHVYWTSRYFIYSLPGIYLIYAIVIQKAYQGKDAGIRKGLLRISLAYLLALSLFSTYLLRPLHDEFAPGVQAAMYIRERFTEDEVIIYAGNPLKHVQYYLPEYNVRSVASRIKPSREDANKTDLYVLETKKGGAPFFINNESTWLKTWSRGQTITGSNQGEVVSLFVLNKSCGTEEGNMTVCLYGSGFYYHEKGRNASRDDWFVWLKKEAFIPIHYVPNEYATMEVSIVPFYSIPNQSIEVLINGVHIGTMNFSRKEWNFAVPSGIERLGYIEFISKEDLSPHEASGSQDRRTLAFGLRKITLRK